MSENQEINNAVLTPEEDYRQSFMPVVRRIGWFTIVVAFFLSMAPFCYGYGNVAPMLRQKTKQKSPQNIEFIGLLWYE